MKAKIQMAIRLTSGRSNSPAHQPEKPAFFKTSDEAQSVGRTIARMRRRRTNSPNPILTFNPPSG
jgi:hypothetical protein